MKNKTTLLFALSGMDNIDKGSVFFNGRNLSSLGENERADLRRTKMGFVFQQPAMLKTLNILDNIILPSTYNEQKNIAGEMQLLKFQKTNLDIRIKKVTEKMQEAGI